MNAHRSIAIGLAAGFTLLLLAGCNLPFTPQGDHVSTAIRGGDDGDGAVPPAPGDSTPTPPPPATTGIEAGIYCPDSLTARGASVLVKVRVQNFDAVARTVTYVLTSEDGWPGLPMEGTISVAAQGSVDEDVRVNIPAAATVGYHSVCGVFTPSGGGAAARSCAEFYVR
jgi:hypothetical protein